MEPKWQIEDRYALLGKFSKFAKNHPDENASVFNNLHKILRLLDGGGKIGGFHVGFFRSEGEGVYRIGQTGVAGALESRLYVYPDQESKLMYILTIGDKDSQPNDINDSHNIVREIKAARSQ